MSMNVARGLVVTVELAKISAEVTDASVNQSFWESTARSVRIVPFRARVLLFVPSLYFYATGFQLYVILICIAPTDLQFCRYNSVLQAKTHFLAS